MNEQWQELKETIIELRDNDGTATQQEVCKFLANLMDILEKQMQEPCETQMIDKSNFSQEQYKADLQSAYDCGKASVKPCEDCISRQAVIQCLEQLVTDIPQLKLYAQKVADAMSDLPSVYPQQRTGHWIAIDGWFAPYQCSECRSIEFTQSNYCPNCGAKMVKPQESEEK